MKITIYIAGILFATLGFIMPVPADSIAPDMPYTVTVGSDEEYLFVMLPGMCQRVSTEKVAMTETEWQHHMEQPTQEEDSGQSHWRGPPACASYEDGFSVASRSDDGRWMMDVHTYEWKVTKSLPAGSGKQYPASGLYPNDGSIQPLWTVDWYAHEVYLSEDGVHLVRMGPWASELEDLAVAFYTRGKLINDYTIKSLLSDPTAIFPTVSHLFWKNEIVFNATSNQLTIETLAKDTHIFDITTGSLISSKTLETLNVHAIIINTDRQRNSLSHLHNCLDTFWESVGLKKYHRDSTNGTLDVPMIIATSNMNNSQAESADIRSLDMWSIPLNEIRSINKISSSDNDWYHFKITFVSGLMREVQLHERFLSFCGKDKNGSDVSFQLKDIDNVIMVGLQK